MRACLAASLLAAAAFAILAPSKTAALGFGLSPNKSGGFDAYFDIGHAYSEHLSSALHVERRADGEVSIEGTDTFVTDSRSTNVTFDILTASAEWERFRFLAGLRYVFDYGRTVEIINETLVDTFTTRNERETTLHLPELRARSSVDLSLVEGLRADLYGELEYAPLFWCSVEQSLDLRPSGLADSLSQSFTSRGGTSLGFGLELDHAFARLDLGIGITSLDIRYTFLTALGRVDRDGSIFDMALSAVLDLKALKVAGFYPTVSYTLTLGQELESKLFVGFK